MTSTRDESSTNGPTISVSQITKHSTLQHIASPYGTNIKEEPIGSLLNIITFETTKNSFIYRCLTLFEGDTTLS